MALGRARRRTNGTWGGAALFATVASAAALTGAAFLTVDQASCDDPGMFVRYDDRTALIGGCIEPQDVPGASTGEHDTPALPHPETEQERGH